MCDYCDCRSHPQIASLSADHDILLRLLSDLKRAVDDSGAERSRALVGRMHDLLEHHAAVEERGVFVELRRADVDNEYLGAFERDHGEIHALLAEIEGRDWQRPARDLIRVLDGHIAREESDLFPAAHQLLTPEQWDAVDAAVADD